MSKKTIEALQEFIDGWKHFCNCMDFGRSALDAKAIRWMDTVPGKLETALKAEKAKKNKPD